MRAKIEWHSSDPSVVRFASGDSMEARNKGTAHVWVSVTTKRGASIESDRVPVEVWAVDHVLLTPRALELPLGTRQQIIAEVTMMGCPLDERLSQVGARRR